MTDLSNRVDINRVLMQMREMRAQIQPQQAPERNPLAITGGEPLSAATRSDIVNAPAAGEPGGFADLLRQAVDSVNATQVQASELQTAYQLGEGNVDITQVMIQMQKASVSFEAMTQVRNRLVSAYQDIMNMPV
ncbi:MAG: flagellar hook-basal body complex protein FliE [Pseudomonas sp.]